MFPSNGAAALDEPVAMIDHEGDDDDDEVQLQQDGADEVPVRPQMTEKPSASSTSASTNRSSSTDELLPSLGAIFQTAYTSSQSSNPSQSAARSGGSNSENSSSSSTPGASLLPNPYSATASGTRISSTSDLFAPEDIHDVFFEDSSSQLFAESDQDDEVDQHHAAVVGAERVQALFVDTSSPRRSPMPGSTTSGAVIPPGFANAGPGVGRSSNPDPFVFYPTPLLTSTPSS